MTRKRPYLFLFLVGGWLLATLACNAPLGGATIPAPPTLVTPSSSTPLTPSSPSPDTIPATGAPLDTVAPDVLPTFTPIVSTGTTLAEPSLEATSSTSVAVTPLATTAIPDTTTVTVPVPQGILSFTYTISWSISEQNPFIAVALVTMNAQGGNGVYTYYRDDLQQDGPVFTYQWATCRDNPGSLRVDSGDGQSVRFNYYEIPPCPQTPSP